MAYDAQNYAQVSTSIVVVVGAKSSIFVSRKIIGEQGGCWGPSTPSRKKITTPLRSSIQNDPLPKFWAFEAGDFL